MAPKALYVHCNAHLCLVVVLNQYLVLLNFFWLVQNIYVFLSSSKCHAIHVSSSLYSIQESLIRQLQRLWDTRSACRQSAISTICYTFDVVATLIKITDDGDGSREAEARGLLLQVKSFKSILLLVSFDRLLTCSKGLSDLLQSTKIDLGKASNLITATIDTVEIFRSDSEWERCWHIVKMLQSNMTFP